MKCSSYNEATDHFYRKFLSKIATTFVRRFREQWCGYVPLGESKRFNFLSRTFRCVAKFTTRTTSTPRIPNNTLVYKLALPVVGRVYGMRQSECERELEVCSRCDGMS